MTERFKMECCGEPVTMIVNDDGVTFEGWDEDAELALIELGFEPSPCWIVADAIRSKGVSLRMMKAAKVGDAAIVSLLLDAGANVHANRDAALRWAASGGHTAVVDILLTSGADIHVFNDTPLRWAAERGHIPVIKMLLLAGASVHARNYIALHKAIHYGHTDAVAILEDWIERHQ